MLEELVEKHGEEYRELIVAALKLYEGGTLYWKDVFSRKEYVNNLIKIASA